MNERLKIIEESSYLNIVEYKYLLSFLLFLAEIRSYLNIVEYK